jgi:hypothetical protein
MIQEQVQRYSDWFVGFTGPVDVQREAYLGIRPYDAERAAAEADYWSREASANRPIGLTAGHYGRSHRPERLQHFSERWRVRDLRGQ